MPFFYSYLSSIYLPQKKVAMFEQKNKRDMKQKIKHKMKDLNQTTSITTLNVNELKMQSKESLKMTENIQYMIYRKYTLDSKNQMD